MINNNILGPLIRLKLTFSERLIDRLPDSIGPRIRELRSDILCSLNDEISDYLKKDKADKTNTESNGIKKVELE